MGKQKQYHILVVDDDSDILEIVSYNLEKEGFQVTLASDGAQALKSIKKHMPDLIILDVMMPAMDGIETCEIIRGNSKYDDILITFLTARGEDYSQIAGFEAGADDYITKPIKPKLLVTKVISLLRRKKREGVKKQEKLEVHGLIIDSKKYRVVRGEEKIDLPKKEFEILLLLASDVGKIFTRDEIFHEIWGEDVVVGGRTIDVHIRKLREKIGPQIIKTVKGVGYKIQE